MQTPLAVYIVGNGWLWKAAGQEIPTRRGPPIILVPNACVVPCQASYRKPKSQILTSCVLILVDLKRLFVVVAWLDEASATVTLPGGYGSAFPNDDLEDELLRHGAERGASEDILAFLA